MKQSDKESRNNYALVLATGVALLFVLTSLVSIYSIYFVRPPSLMSTTTPTLSPADVEGTAVSAALTMVAETPAGIPTSTQLPPTEASSPTPLPTFTPLSFPTTGGTLGAPTATPLPPTRILSPTPLPSFTPIPLITSGPSAFPSVIAGTPNPTETLRAAFSEIDSQFENLMKGNVAFNKPEQMKKNEITSIELILSPFLSEFALATQLVEQGGFATSTADPNILIAPNGQSATIETSQIEITPLLKAVLLPQDPEAFTVTDMHDNAEQVVSTVETTTWRWSVTAKKEGLQTLELIIYQLVKYDGKEFWPEVETYKANIVVEVTVADRFRSMDWKWFAGFILALVGSVLGILTWLSNSKKKAEEEKTIKDQKRKKKQP